MLLLRLPCIVRLLLQGRSLPFRSIVVAFHLDFPAKEYPADIAHGLHSVDLLQNKDAGTLLDFWVHRPCANLLAENDSCTRFCRVALWDLMTFPQVYSVSVKSHPFQKARNLRPVFPPLAAKKVEIILPQSRLHHHPLHSQNSETENPLSYWDCGLHGMDSKSCCCGLDENHRLLRLVGQ